MPTTEEVRERLTAKKHDLQVEANNLLKSGLSKELRILFDEEMRETVSKLRAARGHMSAKQLMEEPKVRAVYRKYDALTVSTDE